MAFLLMVFLALVCLIDPYPAPWWTDKPEMPVLLALVGVLLLALHAWWMSRRFSRQLSRDPSHRDGLLVGHERERSRQQLIQFVLFTLVLVLGGWGWAVRQLWSFPDATNPTNLFPLPGIELLTLLPFLLGQLTSWLLFFDADRAAHRATQHQLEVDLFAQTWMDPRSRAIHLREGEAPFESRWTYALFQARQKLALVFIPVLLLILQKDLVRLLPLSGPRWAGVINLAGIVALCIAFVVMPVLIRLVLGLGPLPSGPVRDRLLACSRRLGFRCSDILLWNTRNGMANALVIGLVPWLRYVVFTDRLVEEFTPEEVEAVFGHEIGHIRHRHMLYYLVFLLGSMLLLGLVAEHYLLPPLGQLGAQLIETYPGILPAKLGDLLGPSGMLTTFPLVGLILGYIFVVFGFLSRRCERQADVFGCRAVSCLDSRCQAHAEGTLLPIRGQGLCPTGIGIFIRALEKVAEVNGMSRDRPGFLQSWQHASIAQRVEFLHSLTSDPGKESAFQRNLLLIKTGLLGAVGGVLAILLLLHGW